MENRLGVWTRSLILATLGFAFGFSANAHAAAGAGIKVVDRKEADAGKSVTLLKTPAVKVTGTCVGPPGGNLSAETFLSARVNNLGYSAYTPEAGFDDFDVDFDRADPKVNFVNRDANGTSPEIEAAEYYEFYVEGRKVPPIRGRVATSVHTKGADCSFSGMFTGMPGTGPLRTTKRIGVRSGKSVEMFRNRSFRVIGSCEREGGDNLRANMFLQARRNGAMYYLTEYQESETNFGPADGKVDITPDPFDAYGSEPLFRAWSYDNEFFAVGDRGGVLQARLGSGVHVKGADCTFSGIFTGPESGSDLHLRNLTKLDRNKSKTLYEDTNFKVTAKCIDNGGGDFTADTSLRAKRRHLMAYAYSGIPEEDLDFNPSDGPIDITTADGKGANPDFRSEDQYTDFYAEGKRGRVLIGRVASGVHAQGADCVFAGIYAG